MQAKEYSSGQLIVRPEIAAAVLLTLDQDRTSDETVGVERNAIIDSLTNAIRSGEAIDLAALRSAESAAHDGQSPTIAGYLLGMIRDRFSTGWLGDWHQFAALGSLAGDIEAAAQA
jgi:hypothetical protein